MREIRTSGLMSGDWKRNYGANCDTGMGESRRQTVQPRSLRPPRQSSTLLARWLRERGVEAYVMHPSSVAVSREHRRAKTDRLDTELLMRAFLGWLRGERRHCSMAAIPTIEEEDAKRPNREHEKLVGDRTRIVNRMKSTLSRFGIRGFKPTLRKADEKLSELRTAEGTLLPENTRAELRRDMTRLRVVREQLKEIEQQRLRKLKAAAPAKKGPHAMVGLIARVIGIGIETADMLVNEILSRHLRDSKAVARYAGVEEHQRIERLQRPVLPFGDLLEDSVRDRTDEISGDVDPIEIAQMALDFGSAFGKRFMISAPSWEVLVVAK